MYIQTEKIMKRKEKKCKMEEYLKQKEKESEKKFFSSSKTVS